MRSDFIDGKVSPYVAVNTGFNILIGSGYTGGFFDGFVIDPSVGVGFNVGSKNRITVGVGYVMNWIKYYYDYGYDYYQERGMAGGIKLKVGLSF